MKTVLVLGNARSGTSMTAGILHYLGVELHHSNSSSDSENPNGGFENVNFNSITTKVYQAFLNNTIQNKKNELLVSLRNAIKNQQRDLWGWKSALTHHHLDFFIKEVSNPYLVIVTRNVYNNALSWKKHMKSNYGKNVSVEEALDNIAKGQLTLIKKANQQNIPKIWTTYESIKKSPLEEAKKISNFLDIEFTDEARQKISNFIISDYTTIN